jgi:hypothetical protein
MSVLGEDTEQIQSARRGRGTGRRGWRARWPLALVLLWAGVAVIDLLFFHVGLGSGAAAKPAKPGVTARRHVTGKPRPAPTATHAAAPPPVVLIPVSAEAFGPTGPASGDNASAAALAIDDSTATAWNTAWYKTAHFGNLQDGTGLMIDMGRRVRISNVQVLLGASPGADVELLTGKAPALADLHVDAIADDAGGQTDLRLARPLRAQYLLIWFTLLPPDSSGTFQASIYNVTVEGPR